jgi:hypothetical protein
MSALADVLLLLTEARARLGEQDTINDDEAVIHLELSMLIFDVQLLVEKDQRETPQGELFIKRERIKWN